MTVLDQRIDDWVGQNRSRITDLVCDLVRLPSENRPPVGGERPAQEHLARWLRKQGMRSEMYQIDQVDGLDEHPLRRPEIDLRNRPNLLLHLPGKEPDDGKSLLLSGHMDTVPRGEGVWRHEPFGGEIEGHRLYGRGAYDMKAGVAANFVTAVMLRELGVGLRGDLYVESVVDEEFAGGHGTLAGRLRGPLVDAVVITEPSELAVYRAHRGLRIVRLTLRGKGGVTFSGERPDPPVHRLPRLIDALVEFGERRNREVRPVSAYAGNPNVVNYMITKVRANTWRDDAVLAVPEEVDVEFFWEAQPGEKRAAIEKEFEEFLEGLGLEVDFNYSLRWMSGFETPADHGFVRCFESNATAALGEAIRAGGAPFPCDLFLCGEFDINAGIMFGPKGGGAHGPDEWVDLDSLMDVVRTLGRVVVDWCGSKE